MIIGAIKMNFSGQFNMCLMSGRMDIPQEGDVVHLSQSASKIQGEQAASSNR
jgi:hypothetical protein